MTELAKKKKKSVQLKPHLFCILAACWYWVLALKLVRFVVSNEDLEYWH